MSAKWEKQEGNDGVLTFEVAPEKFEQALDQAFTKVSKDIQIPGFRKGRIPRKIFESRFGVESLYQDAIDIVLPEAYMGAVEETAIEPVDQPDIDVDEIERGNPIIFTAKVTVKPEVELGQYKELEVEKLDTEVTDDDVDHEIEHMREHLAELVVKEDGQVEEGNTVVIDFEGFMDGEPFDGGKGDNYSLEIGSDEFIPGFEEQLVGKSSGEEPSIQVTFPEDYHEESLAGKEVTFEVTIHEIKEKVLPEIDDEFALDADDDVSTLQELKDKVKNQLQEQKKQHAENEMRQSLLDQAADNATVNIPEAMVETELDHMLREFEQRLQMQMQGITLEMYAQFSGQSIDDLKEQMKEDAEKRVKSNLTLEEIAKQEEIEVSDEEIEEEIQTMAEMYNTDADQIKGMLGGSTDTLTEDLRLRKAIDLLVEESKAV